MKKLPSFTIITVCDEAKNMLDKSSKGQECINETKKNTPTLEIPCFPNGRNKWCSASSTLLRWAVITMEDSTAHKTMKINGDLCRI